MLRRHLNDVPNRPALLGIAEPGPVPVGWIHDPPVHKPPPEPVPAPAAALELPLPPILSSPQFPGAPPPTIPSPASPSPPDSEAQQESEFLRKRKRSWARLISKIWHDDPGICHHCGQPMKIIAAIGPDQPDVIERILRHLNRWDPPWKRQRRARGPPPSEGSQTTRQKEQSCTIDPLPTDDQYSVDLPPPEDCLQPPSPDESEL